MKTGAEPRDLPFLFRKAVWRGRCFLYPKAKRALDLVVTSLALVTISPIWLLIALAIRIEDRGPIFFRQIRIGRGGRRFVMLKFRSMHTDAERRLSQLELRSDDGNDIRFKMRRDPRITRVGRVLRRCSLDELPQLLNVFWGDMSLVGPRPPIPAEVAKYTARDWGRLEVDPGLTCIWQVSGRAEIPFPQQVELDLQYVCDRSLGKDLGLLARTLPAVLSGRGAY